MGSPTSSCWPTIPGDRIFSVQFSDGAAEVRESLVKDTYRHRMVPGEGVFDLAGVIDTLRATGGLRMVGPEVLSVELDELTPAEAVGRAADALDVLLSATCGSAQVVVAAVDHQGRAGDVLAVGAGEVHDAAADVGLRVAPVPEWDRLGDLVDRRRGVVELVEAGRLGERADRVDADPEAAPLDGTDAAQRCAPPPSSWRNPTSPRGGGCPSPSPC